MLFWLLSTQPFDQRTLSVVDQIEREIHFKNNKTDIKYDEKKESFIKIFTIKYLAYEITESLYCERKLCNQQNRIKSLFLHKVKTIFIR